MSDDFENLFFRQIERWSAARYTERHGLVTSYDPKNHLAKVTFQPEGQESGWLPIETGHIGQGYGMAFGLQPGSGQAGGGQQSGGTGGGAGGEGSQGQGQGSGDQVIVRYQEGDFESGKVVQRVHSDEDKPPQVQSGEGVIWTKFKQDQSPGPDAAPQGQQNSDGQKLFFKNDSSLNLEDGSGAAHLLDGKGNTTHNSIGTLTHQVISQRDGSPFQSLQQNNSQSSGGSPQQIHHTTLDKNKGVTTGAFQDQHKTTWDQNGVTHTSSSAVTSTAPNIPHNGNTSVSQNLNVSQSLLVSLGVTAQSYTTSSDARLKSHIDDYSGALDRLMSARVRTFTKNAVDVNVDDKWQQSISTDDPHKTFGFVAQELREAFPELVTGDESKEFLGVQEGKAGIVAIAALQEFIIETRKEIASLREQIKGLKK